VTSRQEKTLTDIYESLPHIPLRFHEVTTEIIEPDVRRIFETGFDRIRCEHKLNGVLWPSLEDLGLLIQLTGRFLIFKFATTALTPIGYIYFTPAEQFQRVLARKATFDDVDSYDKIDALYNNILQVATRDESGKSNARLCQCIGDLLRTTVLLEEPLSVTSLAHLLQTPQSNITKAVGALSAFLGVARSLHDFLCDSARCRNRRLLVKTSVQHHVKKRER
jgi:hypothetical protein